MFEQIIGYSVALFLFQPLNVFVHELGHGFFAKLFGGKVHKIEVGIGEPLFSIGKLQVNKQFFIMGYCRFDSQLANHSKIKLSLILLGGVIFNMITILLLIAIKMNTTHHHFLDGYYFGFTGMLILSALIPMTYFTGDDSDGKRLIRVLTRKQGVN